MLLLTTSSTGVASPAFLRRLGCRASASRGGALREDPRRPDERHDTGKSSTKFDIGRRIRCPSLHHMRGGRVDPFQDNQDFEVSAEEIGLG